MKDHKSQVSEASSSTSPEPPWPRRVVSHADRTTAKADPMTRCPNACTTPVARTKSFRNQPQDLRKRGKLQALQAATPREPPAQSARLRSSRRIRSRLLRSNGSLKVRPT